MEPLLFAINATRPLGERIAAAFGAPLGAHEEREFPDGEHKARPLVNVRGRDVFIIHSLYGEPSQSANDKLCRLLFFIGAVKDAGAGRVTAVIPYLAYARKDRKTKSRDPVTSRYVALLLEAVGVDHVLCLEVHNLAAFQNAFRCQTDHLEGGSLFADHFAQLIGPAEATVVSPDTGGVKRADRFRQRLQLRLNRLVGSAFVEKRRSEGVVSGGTLIGEVRGRVAVLFDDLIGSGETLSRAAFACHEAGAAKVYAAAAHGLFVDNAPEVLSASRVERVAVSDSVPPFRLEGSAAMERLTLVDSAPLFAEAIRAIHLNGSLVDLGVT